MNIHVLSKVNSRKRVSNDVYAMYKMYAESHVLGMYDLTNQNTPDVKRNYTQAVE